MRGPVALLQSLIGRLVIRAMGGQSFANLVLQAAQGQTGNTLEINSPNSTGGNLAKVDTGGNTTVGGQLFVNGNSTGTPISITTSWNGKFSGMQVGGSLIQSSNNNFSVANNGGSSWLNNVNVSSLGIYNGTGNAIVACFGSSSGGAPFYVSTAGVVTQIHGVGGSSTPTIAAGTGAGTSPTISITGSDMGGQITLTTGTLPTGGGTIFTVTFALAFSTAPYITFSAANANAAGLSGLTAVYATATTTTFLFTSDATGLTAATQYIWAYDVVG
jgi:hypothetical protein